MAVTFELPLELERLLRRDVENLDHAAKEAFLVELYRARILSHFGLSEALGIDRLETEAVLKRHHVVEDLPTAEDLEEDRRALERILGSSR